VHAGTARVLLLKLHHVRAARPPVLALDWGLIEIVNSMTSFPRLAAGATPASPRLGPWSQSLLSPGRRTTTFPVFFPEYMKPIASATPSSPCAHRPRASRDPHAA